MLNVDKFKNRVFHLLDNGRRKGVWSGSGLSYAFSDFVAVELGVILCTRYQIHPDRETHFQGLEDCSINSPTLNYQILGVNGIEARENDGGVIIVITDVKTRQDLKIPNDHDLVLTYYPALQNLSVSM